MWVFFEEDTRSDTENGLLSPRWPPGSSLLVDALSPSAEPWAVVRLGPRTNVPQLVSVTSAQPHTVPWRPGLPGAAWLALVRICFVQLSGNLLRMRSLGASGCPCSGAEDDTRPHGSLPPAPVGSFQPILGHQGTAPFLAAPTPARLLSCPCLGSVPLCLPGPARKGFWFLLLVPSRDAVGVVSTNKQSPQECRVVSGCELEPLAACECVHTCVCVHVCV